MRIQVNEGEVAQIVDGHFMGGDILIEGLVTFYRCSFYGKVVATLKAEFRLCNFEGDCSGIPLGCFKGNNRIWDTSRPVGAEEVRGL